MDKIFAKIHANRVEVERLTLEAVKRGLTDKLEIEKYLNAAIKTTNDKPADTLEK